MIFCVADLLRDRRLLLPPPSVLMLSLSSLSLLLLSNDESYSELRGEEECSGTPIPAPTPCAPAAGVAWRPLFQVKVQCKGKDDEDVLHDRRAAAAATAVDTRRPRLEPPVEDVPVIDPHFSRRASRVSNNRSVSGGISYPSAAMAGGTTISSVSAARAVSYS